MSPIETFKQARIAVEEIEAQIAANRERLNILMSKIAESKARFMAR